MLLTDILLADSVVVPLEASDKPHAIAMLADVLGQRDDIEDADELREAVMRRESTRTTGIGHGVAIPHGKFKGCATLGMAVGKTAEPIDFDSIDGKPVDLIFLLASPEDQTGPHIQALAGISRMLTDVELRGALKRAETAEDLYRMIAEHEATVTADS